MQQIKRMIYKYNITILPDGNHLLLHGTKMDQNDMRWIKEHKTDILSYIRKQKEQKTKQEQRRDREYRELEKKLPEFTPPQSEKDDAKARELLAKAERIKFFSGPEMDGVNLSQAVQKEDLIQEAQKYCDHQFDTKIERGYTYDARLKVTRIITCPKCGYRRTDTVEGPLSESQIWR